MTIGILSATRFRPRIIGPGVLEGVVVVGLVGQSNMVGRYGPVDGVLDATDSNILMYSAGALVTASDPLDHFDETADTVGPGLSFAKRFMTLNPGITKLILVPAADGGTGHLAANWNRNDVLYGQAIARIDAAMALAVSTYGAAQLGAIIHHQGENEIDGADGAAMDQAEFRSVKSMFARDFRADLADANANTPIVFGGLSPEWMPAFGTTVAQANSVMSGLGTYATKFAYADPSTPTVLVGVVGDLVHFPAVSAREMGVRMADAVAVARAQTTVLPTYPTRPAGNFLLHFNHTGVADGFPLKETSGNDPKFSNRRVCLVGGKMQFAYSPRNVSRRLNFLRNDLTPLTDQNFYLRTVMTPDGIVGTPGLVGLWNNTGNKRSWLLRQSSSGVQFFFSLDGTTSTTLSAIGVLTAGVETEVVVRRAGGLIYLEVGGVHKDVGFIGPNGFFDVVDTDIGVTIGDHDNIYGTNTNSTSNPYFGTIGILTLEQLADTVVTDPYISNVSLLAEMDAPTGNRNLVNPATATILKYLNCDLQSGAGKFGDAYGIVGGTSRGGLIDGSAADSKFSFAGGDFTVEAWSKRPSNAAALGIMGKYLNATSQRQWLLFWANGFLRGVTSNDGTTLAVDMISAAASSINTWIHVCMERSGNDFRLYQNGVMVGKVTQTGFLFNNSARDMTFLANNNDTTQPAGLYIDQMRVTKGVARYASDAGFTPPTGTFPTS